MENVFIHLKPTRAELEMAFWEMFESNTLRFLPEWIRSLSGWMDYFYPAAGADRAISFCPVVIEVDGRYPAVIYLSDWRERGHGAQVHFAAHANFRPKTVLSACRLALELVLNSKEVDLLEVCCEVSNVRALKMARAFGFVEVARVAGCVYSQKTTKGEIYARAKSKKTSGTAKGGGSGVARKCRCAGGGGGGASQIATAKGASDDVSGESCGGRAVCEYA
jgi:RimJ/RimL family protein N-acetyltransferase